MFVHGGIVTINSYMNKKDKKWSIFGFYYQFSFIKRISISKPVIDKTPRIPNITM